MSHLKGLKFASAIPSTASSDPVTRARDKVVVALIEQKHMAEAKIAGQTFAPTHTVRRKNAEGQSVDVETLKRVRQGWFSDGSGKIFFAVRYAGKTIEFAKDRNAVEVGELPALPSIIDMLVAAVRAGELDEQLGKAAAERGKLIRKIK